MRKERIVNVETRQRNINPIALINQLLNTISIYNIRLRISRLQQSKCPFYLLYFSSFIVMLNFSKYGNCSHRFVRKKTETGMNFSQVS